MGTKKKTEFEFPCMEISNIIRLKNKLVYFTIKKKQDFLFHFNDIDQMRLKKTRISTIVMLHIKLILIIPFLKGFIG